MPIINTETGTVTRLTVDDYTSKLQALFTTVFGENMRFDAETPQQQLIAGIATGMADSDNVIVAGFQALDITRSYDQQLDGHAALLAIPRLDQTRTIVDAVITGIPASLIPAGARARTNDGDLFELRDAVTLDGSGDGTGVARALEYGEVPCPAGTLINIAIPETGWETITNPADGTLGSVRETNGIFTRRYFNEVDKNASTPIAAIIARVAEQENVSTVTGQENDTKDPIVVQSITIDPNSVCVIVDGGANQDIADAIRDSKGGGTGTTGDQSVDVIYDNDGYPYTKPIKFYRADDVPVTIDLTISTLSGFPSNGLELIKQRLINYFSGDIEIVTDAFEIDGIKIAETLYKQRLYTPVNSVPNHVVSGFVLARKGFVEDVELLTPTLIQRYIIESDADIVITVV